MSKNELCEACGIQLVDGACANDACARSLAANTTGLPYGSLTPEDITSLDPSEIVDYTGTLGAAPEEFGSAVADDFVVDGEEDDIAPTRMIDDNFYQQIQTFFPTDSGSKSARSDSKIDDSSSPAADVSRSVSLRSDRSNLAIEEFVPPVREIRFPSDTASLDEIRELDPATIEGDEYHIVEKLGEGGYGIVFEAEQTALNRPVAIKVLKPKKKKGAQSKTPSRSGTGTGELQRRRDQFLHEAKITARLQHPNIVPLYDFGINSTGQLFYSMKKVQERPWSDVLHKPTKLLNIAPAEVDELAERQAISRNIEIFSRVCDAMAYAHSMNVVHRDLKPDNIMIGDYGEVLLIDFGMALDLSGTSRDFSAGGTLVYMAPEMALHFSKQKEIQIAAQKTARKLGVEKGTVFLDQSNVVGVGSLARRLIQDSQDKGLVELAETLIRLDAEEKDLAGQISYTSDIYLLGAMLYQIAIGHPPHYFPLSACKNGAREKFQKELWLALRNGFQKYSKITDPLRLSLQAIAIQAMRTDPKDRYQSVEELQEAIRGFQRQVQSLELTETGKESLEKAKGREDYQHLLPALESFRGAGELWPDSVEAKTLRRDTACEYANRASKRRDFEAGLSVLDEYVFEDQQSEKPVVKAREDLLLGRKRSIRNRRLAVLSSLAAVALPIATFVGFAFATANVRNEAKIANESLAAVEVELEVAETKTKEAKVLEQAAVAKAAEASGLLADAESQLAQVEPQLKEAARVKQELAVIVPKLELAKEEAEMADENRQEAIANLETVRTSLTTAETAKKEAEAAKKEAETAAEQSKKLAAQFQFDADFGEYNSNVLTIPLDFRTSKLEEAKSKLETLTQSDAQPYFKNGWLVKHFAKRLNSGKSVLLSDNAVITDLVSIPDSSDAWAVGTDSGKPAVWKISNGASTPSGIEIKQTGQVADASASSDGKWLGIAFDSNQDAAGATAVVIDTQSGNSIELPAESLNKLAGCSGIEFSDTDSERFAVVEEIKGFYDLKQRVHVVVYRIANGQLEELSRTKFNATERNEDRVTFLATVKWENGKPKSAVAFDSLDNDGADVQKLQSVSGSQTSDAIEIDRFPTALFLGQNNKLYCGHSDGKVDYFDAANLAAGARPVAQNKDDKENTNKNEYEIASISESSDGQLITASTNGKIVVWNADRTSTETFDGQEGQLSSIAITRGEQDVFTFLSGDLEGNVNFWSPGSDSDPWKIDKPSPTSVTCGAIDQSLDSGPVPASAYGTTDGEVFYFNSEEMKKRGGGKRLDNGQTEISSTFRFKSPFESFDTAFDDFDSMGIIDDYFVVMKANGSLVTTFIDRTPDRKDFASSRMKSFEHREKASRDYVPLMGSVHDRDYFYTNSPADRNELLLWHRDGARFSSVPVSNQGGADGEIKRLAMSADGNWLAIVRLANRLSGEYRTEVVNVSGGKDRLAASKTSDLFRVGDPAFVGFSDDSSKLIFHRHKLGVDRETFVESWNLAGSQWVAAGDLQKVADQKVDLVDWSDSEETQRLVTRLNRNFYLNQFDADSSESFPRGENRTRNVLSTGNANQFYVLTTRSLTRYNGVEPNGKRVEAIGENDVPVNARDMRVFGDRVVVLDQKGFHLFNSDLQYITKLADRNSSVSALSLSGDKLAVLYDNQLCRIWNVGGERPTGVGRVDSVSKVELSPDGRWAACLVGDQIQIFDVGSVFETPARVIPLAGGAFHWTGKDDSELLVATVKDDRTEWTQHDPATGKFELRTDLPAAIEGVADFKLAPRTENFVAVKSADGMSLWATAADPVLMTKEDHEFDAASLQDVRSISFSEIKQPKANEIGTRMAVLAGDESDDQLVPRIYLLARQEQSTTVDDGVGGLVEQKELRYRAVEIEGALQSSENSALEFQALQFSGDGKSLLEVHRRGLQTLLSE